MSKLTIGMVDYGAGNHASLRQCLHGLDMRCRVSDERAVLEACDVVVLPGVGAFQLAMQALQAKALDRFLHEQEARRKPILGICLGMQLVAEASYENGLAAGLGLIPGQIVPLGPREWHIGWNTVDVTTDDPLFAHAADQTFYFNHAYGYQGPPDFQACRTTTQRGTFASVIRRERVVGLQFHPEKSQTAGHALLKQIIIGLANG